MSNGPFRTKEGAERIGRFMKDELFPTLEAFQVLAVEVSSLRLGFVDSFGSKRLDSIEARYVELLGRFMRLYRTWFDPDELFKGIEAKDPQKAAMLLGDYTGAKQAIQEHVNEGFRLLAQVDRIISDHKTTAYNRLTMFLSIVAITLSIVVALLGGG